MEFRQHSYIATAQSSFQNHIFTLRAQTFLHNKIVFGNEKRLAKTFLVPNKGININVGHIEMQRSVLVIRAVATLEPKCLVQSNSEYKGHDNLNLGVDSRNTSVAQYDSSYEDSEEVDEREKLRRMRISKANKGNTPWNKGRKHSAETKQRIRERTRLAMQHPKVKMKLVNLGHAQSEETRMKIGIGVRMGWERRREKLKLQETCYFEWQNLIAEASRKGFVGEEEKQWNSYKILDEQLEQEWLESVEQRRKMARPKGSKRAPKSLEQRRKISEAISAKWADPVRAYVAFSAENAYRDRVCTALHKYHGTPVGAERKPKRRPRSSERQPRIQNPTKKKANDTDNSTGNVTESQKRRTRLRSNMPLFKDPLASSKLEMIKNIRAERAAAETKKTEAIERAKLLIAEAEKAAKALEAAATKSPLAQASLIETRNLIAEAIQSIQSIEIGQIDSHGNGRHPSIASAELVNQAEKGNNPGVQGLSQRDNGEINGTQTVESSKSDYNDFGFGKFNFHDLLNGKEELYQTSMSDYGLPPSELDGIIKQCSFTEQLSQLELNGNGAEYQSRKEETPPNSITVAKKWVRGRLVEVVDGD
ncbi:unnamed protein product [Camellia sinensis]